MKNSVLEFYSCCLFGKSLGFIKDNKEEGFELIVRRAYLDWCRTAKFKENADKKEYINETLSLLKESIYNKLILSKNKEEFDNFHKEICEGGNKSISSISNKYCDEFHFGQAQKWLNMTLKYMMILGFCGELIEDGEIHSYLHAPVDRYIIDATRKMDDVIIPFKNVYSREKLGKCEFCDYVIPWSQWNYDQYNDFQSSLRNRLEKDSIVPIDWECEAWVKQANIRD